MNLTRTFLLTLIFAASGFSGSAQTLQTLVTFSGTNGASPNALTLGNDGYFYGTTGKGGITNSAYTSDASGMGTIFKVMTNGELTTLVSFAFTNGANPNALTLGSDGIFYGTTGAGGMTNFNYLNNSYGYGTVFTLLLQPVVRPTLTLQFWSGYPLLSLYGTLSNTYTVEYTTNLAVPNWTPLLIVPDLLISPFKMLDPAGIVSPTRFYRAVQSQ